LREVDLPKAKTEGVLSVVETPPPLRGAPSGREPKNRSGGSLG